MVPEWNSQYIQYKVHPSSNLITLIVVGGGDGGGGKMGSIIIPPWKITIILSLLSPAPFGYPLFADINPFRLARKR